ncbi:unnamed protein product [Paramecium sonneborni]|uniref:Uncharacterized protein n=1 Tax=Paramecium sonneborni TaxID=65129 RepID=A0A8S1QM70_9CILI|nr:unnamed protein product [Paramecium sonneborni]
MNSQGLNFEISSNLIPWSEGIEEVEIKKKNLFNNILVKEKIEINLTQDNKIIYLKDGAILKIENRLIIIQIQKYYLVWNRQNIFFGKVKVDQMLLFAFWNGEEMVKVKGYYIDVMKQGYWIELIKNYWIKAQVLKVGILNDDLKIGMWNYIYKNYNINGGQYNNQGKKIGKWIELSEVFGDCNQVTFN